MDYYNRRTNFNRPVPIMCKYFKYGDCFNGDNCHYLHASLCRDDGRCKDDNCNKSHVKQRDPATYLKNVRRFQPNHFRRSPNRRSRSRSRSSRSKSRSSYGSFGRRSKSPSFSPKKISKRRSRSKSDYGYQKRSNSPSYISSKRISTSPYLNQIKEKGRRRSHSFSPVPARRKHTASPNPLRREQSVSPPPSRKKHSNSPPQSKKKRSVSSASSGSTSTTSSSSSGSIMITKTKSFSDKREKDKKRKVKKIKDSQTQNGSTVDEREENSRDVLIIKQESPADLYDCLDEKPSPKSRKDSSSFKPIGEVLQTRTSGDSKGKDLAKMLAAESEYSPSTRALHILKNLPKDFFDAPKVPVKESSDTDQEAFREAFLKALSSTELASSTNVTPHHKEKMIPSMMRHPLNAESLAKPFQDKLYGVEATNVEAWTPAADRSNKTKSTKHGSKNVQVPAGAQSISNWEVDTPYVPRNKHGEVTHASLSTTALSTGKMLPPPSKSKRQASEPKKKKKKHHRQISSSSSSSTGDEDETLDKEEESNAVEIGDKEREEALEKKKDILSRVWTLMGQKKKLEMQRDEIALSHKGEGKSLPALLQENSVLSAEIDKQIYIMNQMVQIINGRLGISKNETHMQDFYYQPKLFGDSELPPLFLKQYTTDNLEKSVNLYLKAPEDSNKNVNENQSIPKRQRKPEKSKSRSRSHSKDRKRSKSSEHKSKKHNKEKKQKKDKSPVMEIQKSSAKKDKKRESKKPPSTSTKVKSPTKVKSKSTGEVEYAPSPAMKPHVKYIDQGMHWCQICNDFQDTVPDYIIHLQSGHHIEKLMSDPKPWLPEPSKIEKEPIRPGAPVITIPLKGMEFTHSLTAFYCSLCDVFMKSKEEAEAHGETKIHVSKYKEYLSSNPMYETSYVKDKMAAYAKYSVEKERSRERASTLEETNQEAFFCEVKKKMGVNLSSQNSISFEGDTSNDDTFNNSEEITGDCKEAEDYICDEEISKTDNEDNERKEIAGVLGSVNNIDDESKNGDDWGEVLEEALIEDENMDKDHLDVEENCIKGKETESQNKDQNVEEKVGAEIKGKDGIDIEDKGKQDLEVKDDTPSLKKEGDHHREGGDITDDKEHIHLYNDEQKAFLDKEKDNFDCRLSKVHEENENDCGDKKKTVDFNNLEMEMKSDIVMKNNIKEELKEDLKEEKCLEDLSGSQKNADKVEKRKAKNERKEEKKLRKREKKEDYEDGEDTSNITNSKKNVNTSSIRVSSRSLSSSNMHQQNESKKGSSRESRKRHSAKSSDDFGYYKEKRLSVEEEEKIKALKERIKKKENVENEEASDEELDSNEVDKPKKMSNVMIGKMPFLKRSKCSSSGNKKNLNKADLNGSQLSVTAAEERIRKIVSEGINPNNLQNSDEHKMEIDSKSIPLSLHPNVEYITEIQSSGDESMFVKTVGPVVQKEEKSSEAKILQKMDYDQIELNNLPNKEVINQKDNVKGSSTVEQNFSSKSFDEIPVPQTDCKTMQKSDEITSTCINMNRSLSNQQKTNSCYNAASKKESFIPELKPPPLPFISVQSNVVSSNQHIVLPDLRKPPPNIVQHNFTTPNSQRSVMPNNFSTASNQQIMQHNQTPNQRMMPHNLPAPPSNYHMMGSNLPVPPPSQHMMGHNLLTPPPGQHMLGHNITAPPSGQHLLGHNLSTPPPNQHLMGHNLTVPPPNQNYSPLHQQGRRMEFSLSPQSPMMGPSNSNFSMSSQNPSMIGSQNSNYSMSPQISPTTGPLNPNFSIASQNPLMVGPSSSNFTRSQNSPMMGQFRSNSEFSMSPHNPVSIQQNNSMMDQNYNTRSNPKLLGSTLPLPPTPPEIGINTTNYVESPPIMKPPPPPFNFSSLTPSPKIVSNDSESGRNPTGNKVPAHSSSGTKATNESTITEINNQKETLNITPSMEKCLDNFFETILDDIPVKTVNKSIIVKTVSVKSSKKGVNLNSKAKEQGKTCSHDSPKNADKEDIAIKEKASNEEIAIKANANNKDAPGKAKSEAVTRKTRSVTNSLKNNTVNVFKSCTKAMQNDGSNEKAESLDEPDTLVQEGLELLEFAEETGTSPKPNFNWDSSQDSI